jgi:hypothetical protein
MSKAKSEISWCSEEFVRRSDFAKAMSDGRVAATGVLAPLRSLNAKRALDGVCYG